MPDFIDQRIDDEFNNWLDDGIILHNKDIWHVFCRALFCGKIISPAKDNPDMAMFALLPFVTLAISPCQAFLESIGNENTNVFMFFCNWFLIARYCLAMFCISWYHIFCCIYPTIETSWDKRIRYPQKPKNPADCFKELFFVGVVCSLLVFWPLGLVCNFMSKCFCCAFDVPNSWVDEEGWIIKKETDPSDFVDKKPKRPEIFNPALPPPRILAPSRPSSRSVNLAITQGNHDETNATSIYALEQGEAGPETFEDPFGHSLTVTNY